MVAGKGLSDGLPCPRFVAQNSARIAFSLVGLAIALRLLASLFVPMVLESDARAYWTMAVSFADGNGLVDTFANRAYYSGGYPLVLGSLFAVFGESLVLVLGLNILLGGISVYLLYRTGRSLFGPHGGLLAAGLWAVFPPALLCATQVGKENLMIPLMLGLAWTAVAWPRARHRLPLAVLGGVLTGALAVVGMTGSTLGAALAAVILVSGRNWRERLGHVSMLVLAGFLTAAPWLYRNVQVVGAPVLNTNGGFNLYLGNNPAATGYFVSISETPFAADWHRIRKEEGELAADKAARRKALSFIKDHPMESIALALKRSALFWEFPTIRGVEPSGKVEALTRIAWFVLYLVICSLSLAALRLWGIAWPLFLSIGLYAAIHVPFYVMSRYRLPIEPLLCLLAAGAAWEFLQRRVGNFGARPTGQG